MTIDHRKIRRNILPTQYEEHIRFEVYLLSKRMHVHMEREELLKYMPTDIVDLTQDYVDIDQEEWSYDDAYFNCTDVRALVRKFDKCARNFYKSHKADRNDFIIEI
jgi:hypothetical protein